MTSPLRTQAHYHLVQACLGNIVGVYIYILIVGTFINIILWSTSAICYSIIAKAIIAIETTIVAVMTLAVLPDIRMYPYIYGFFECERIRVWIFPKIRIFLSKYGFFYQKYGFLKFFENLT